MKVIIESDKTVLQKLIDEYKKEHTNDFNSEECKKYVRKSIIESVSINDADIRFMLSDDNYVTW